MVEKLCTFLDSGSFITFSLPHYKLHKPIFTLLPNLPLLNSTPTCTSSLTTRTRRRNCRLLNLTVFCTPFSSSPSSLDFDIVSTAEGSDGSILFRFGDASEVKRIKELEESRKLEELRELEECGNEVKNDLEVLDGSDEEEVIVKPIQIEESAVKEEHSDFLPQLSENSVQITDERDLQADILESSTSTLDYENVSLTENSIQNDRDENSTSTSITLSDNSLNIEGKILEENIGDESMFESGNVAVAVIEVPQSDRGDISENLQIEPKLNESSSISKLEPEISEVPDDEATEVEVSSGDLKEVLGAGAVMQLTESQVIGEEVSTAKLCLSSGAALLPHPSKALAGGEESYFVTNLNWLGVADGVGQWSLEGSNPGVYARELMEHCGKIVSNSGGVSILKPVEVLQRIVEEAQSPGSSTILLAHFDGQILHVANIGDSGFIIIRNGTVHRRSSPMHHDFHFPLQIAKGHDPSELVEEYNIYLEIGDIVVTATDGLLDNLYMEEIASIVSKSVQAKINTQEIAKLLARRAQEVGKSAFGNSPFADSARAAGYKRYTGGKLDDVAVIVSIVQERLISNA